jgi:hypothetical protein
LDLPVSSDAVVAPKARLGWIRFVNWEAISAHHLFIGGGLLPFWGQ